MPFVKLDCGLLDSTLWLDRVAREIFITALLMAEPREFKESIKQINIRDLKFSGFKVPPGWYGFVAAAGVGIIRRAGVDTEEGLVGLEKLGSKDPESRSSEFEGRRLVRIDGGFLVLNFIKYREKDATTADRSRRWRERQKLKEKTTRVTLTPTRVIRHQAEAEEYSKGKISKKEAVNIAQGLVRSLEGNSIKEFPANEEAF
jgi:hypothetical protein